MRNGTTEYKQVQVKGKMCSVDGCGRKHAANDLCKMHGARLRVYGRLYLIKGEYGKGHVDSRGYRKIGTEYEHRLVMEELLKRPLMSDENVHHKNGNRSDNHSDNLELWATIQPSGQRVKDLLDYADEIIRRYR
jgi:hypothetical protein